MVMQLKPNEVTSMMNEFDNPGTLAPTGLQIGGSSYFVIRGEPDAIIRGTGKNVLTSNLFFQIKTLYYISSYFTYPIWKV